MHGLINKAIQSFVCATYGVERWHSVTVLAKLGFDDFEAMLVYDDDLTVALLDALSLELCRKESELLEDLGTYLVSNPQTERLRRLLRFGGVTYQEFLHSLEELPDRARLAVSDLSLPKLELCEEGANQFFLICAPGLPGYSHVMMGVLRAMADDYGALALLEHLGRRDNGDHIEIRVIEHDFAEGRDFLLGAGLG